MYECPICGQKFLRDFWGHYEVCSKRRQTEIYREWNRTHPVEERVSPPKPIYSKRTGCV